MLSVISRARRSALRILIIGVVAMSLVQALAPSADAGDKVIRIVGTEDFVPNVKIFSSFRFNPGPAGVKQGESLTWIHQEDLGAPHTITIVDAADLPTTIEEAFGDCQPCEQAAEAHFGPGFGGPITFVVETDGSAPGLDAPGDSLLVFPEGDITAAISAPAGTTLDYVCALHPWMQGSIRVR